MKDIVNVRELAAEVVRLRERTDAVRRERDRALALAQRRGIPPAGLVGLELAVLHLDGELPDAAHTPAALRATEGPM